jgi:tetratricopeptide (TPR) repeat protein
MDKNTFEQINTPGTDSADTQERVEHSESSFPQKKLSLMEKISFWALMATSFLLPIFFYNPFPGFSLDFSKKTIILTGIMTAILFWFLARFEDGRLVVPGGWLAKSAVILFAGTALSSLFAPTVNRTIYHSIFGIGFDLDTVSMLFVLLVAMFLSSIYFQNLKRLTYFYSGLILAFFIVFISGAINIFYGGGFIPGSGMISNLVGRWNDLGIFMGLCAIVSLAIVELINLNFYPRIFAWTVLVSSLLSVGLVNYGQVWFVIGMVALLVLVYSFFFGSKEHSEGGGVRVLFRPSFWVVVVALVAFLAQTQTGALLAKYNIVNIDVRPSLSATLDLAKNTYTEGWRTLFFGVGPNNFSSQWLKYKPVVVNDTIFWNIDFNVGFGHIPSSLITAGVLGFLSWIIFLSVLLAYGFRTILYSSIPKSSRFMVFVSFAATIYLWSFSLVYVPGFVLVYLTFVLTGIFIASLIKAKQVGNIEVSFLGDPRLSFISVLILVVLVVSNISVAYLAYKKLTSNYLFQKSVYVANASGDFDSALALLRSAVGYDEQDVYYRTISEFSLGKLSRFISEQKVADKDSVAKVQDMIRDASSAARKAIDANGSNYLNWLALGRVGEAVVPLGVVEGSYSLALDSYKKAQELNPRNPTILLNMARLEIANNNITDAKKYLTTALQLKSNFTAALYLLSQIEASEGNLSGAIAKAEQAYLFAPDDLGVLFQLGFLKFSNKDYEGAIAVLERAEVINPQYSNAKYFLGLSYAKVGKNSQAIKQFRDIGALNPDNAEVKTIISNLLQGKDPFAAAVSAKQDSVSNGKLPINE